MNWKKILIYSFSIIGILILGIIGYVGFRYYKEIGQYTMNNTMYPHDLGYINPEEAQFSKDFSLCNPDLKLNGFYSSAHNIFRGGKYQFKRTISEKYKNNGFSDSGFLNLRFHINCTGNVGNVEINELNTNYEITELNDSLVHQLVSISVAEENWIPKEENGKSYDSYMYLIFTIENGEVLEILP